MIVSAIDQDAAHACRSHLAQRDFLRAALFVIVAAESGHAASKRRVGARANGPIG